MDESFVRNDHVLDAIPLDGHKSEEISSQIQLSLESNGLTIEKTICLVRDDASNMKKSAHILEINRYISYFDKD